MTADKFAFNSYRLFGSVNVSAREIDSQERRIADDLRREVRKIANQKGVATETLVNLWLQEKIAAASSHSS